jgi:hypothetical protein
VTSSVCLRMVGRIDTRSDYVYHMTTDSVVIEIWSEISSLRYRRLISAARFISKLQVPTKCL